MNDITVRFLEFYNYCLAENLTANARDFAQKIGVSASLMTEITKGRTQAGAAVIQNTVTYFTILSADWLLTGRGKMLVAENNADLMLGDCDNIGVPFYDLPVSAGALGAIDCGAHNPVSYSRLPIFEDCTAIFPVVGISMEPEILSGDIIGVSELDAPFKWDFLNTSRRYLIISREERMIKYISDASHPDYIICSSPNAAPFKVAKEDILQIYQVKAVGRRL